MEIINILLSIAAIISMALAVAIGLSNGVKSLFFSAIMYILAIDYVLIVLRQSLAFNFYEFKFILLIPNVLLGVAAFLHTKIEISDSIKFKWYYILGLIAMVFFYSYLLINRADDNSPIYHVLKSAINFSAIFLALSNIDKELSNNRFGNINTVSNLKKINDF